MKREKKNKNIERIWKKGFKLYSIMICGLLIITMSISNVYAADDPIAVINNLSDFMYKFVKGVGALISGYGIVQIGLSFTSHDASQRANGFLYFAGGVLIMCAKTILTMIGG